MNNEFEVRGKVTAIVLKSPKYGRLETLIDTDKLSKVKQFEGTWSVYKNSRSDYFYVRHYSMRNGIKKSVALHRLLTDAPEGLVVDHINHDTLNNTNANLRVVTPAENQQNRLGPAKGSSSNIRGVYKHKQCDKWQAKIRLNGKLIHLGSYKDIKDAESAAIEARAKYHKYA